MIAIKRDNDSDAAKPSRKGRRLIIEITPYASAVGCFPVRRRTNKIRSRRSADILRRLSGWEEKHENDGADNERCCCVDSFLLRRRRLLRLRLSFSPSFSPS